MSSTPFRNHPWHPALVHFPIACWVLATLLDIATNLPFAGEWLSNHHLGATAHLLLWIGLAFAMLASIAGMIDYMTLPVGAIKTIHRHILWMGAATALFLVAGVWRVQVNAFDSPVHSTILVIEVFGTLCLVAGGRAASVVVFEKLVVERSPTEHDSSLRSIES